MIREHYNFVVEYFNLEQYSSLNFPNWESDMVSCSDLYVRRSPGSDKFTVSSKKDRDLAVFLYLPSAALAEEVIQYAKDTELLFV